MCYRSLLCIALLLLTSQCFGMLRLGQRAFAVTAAASVYRHTSSVTAAAKPVIADTHAAIALRKELQKTCFPADYWAVLPRPECSGAAIQKKTFYADSDYRCDECYKIEGAKERFFCLVSGYRDVIWYSVEAIKKEVDPDLVDRFIAQCDIQELRIHRNGWASIMLYTPKGERNAALLAKFIYLKKWYNYPASSHLTGTLLGYAQEDIDFFHVRSDFIDYYFEKYRGDARKMHRFNSEMFGPWSPGIRREFEAYEKDIWDKAAYAKDKEATDTFIKNHEQYTPRELLAQVKALGDAVDAKKAEDAFVQEQNIVTMLS